MAITVEQAIKIAERGEKLKKLQSSISEIEDKEKVLFSKMKNSFNNTINVFSNNGVVFEGVFFSLDDLNNYLDGLQNEINKNENERATINSHYDGMDAVYSDAAAGEDFAKLVELNDKISKDKQKYEVLQNDALRLKESKAESKFESFDYISRLFESQKDNMLSRLDEIKDEALRIEVEAEIEKTEKFNKKIKEKRKEKQEYLDEIQKIGDEIGIEIVCEDVLEHAEPEKEMPEKSEPEKGEFEKADSSIKNPKSLADVVVELNPTKGLSIVEESDGLSLIYDGAAETLMLPEGFKYDSVLGINNKVDDKTDIIALPVKKSLKREATPVDEELKKYVAEKVKGMLGDSKIVSGPRASRIPSGKIHVKTNPQAIIPIYSKALIVGAAIGGVTLTLTALLALPEVLTVGGLLGFVGGGAGLSAGIQKLQHKILSENEQKIQELEELGVSDPMNKDWTVAMMAKLQDGIKKLTKKFSKKSRTVEKSKEEVPPSVEPVEPEVAPVVEPPKFVEPVPTVTPIESTSIPVFEGPAPDPFAVADEVKTWEDVEKSTEDIEDILRDFGKGR